MISDLLSSVTSWYLDHINYATVTLLMGIESSFIPFPSEIVVPPAAYKAARGTLNAAGVFGAATAGALAGALFNYYLALLLGRKVLYRLADTRVAHFFLITNESLQKAEAFFRAHGRSSTFIGRLVPAIRQLISLPAGLARMDVRQFLIYTALGSGIWNLILTALGYFLYSQKELLERYYHCISMTFLVCGAVFVGYMLYNALKKGKRKADTSEQG
ncbi:MAG: DedA family protein [Chitinispirillaceae bacterium]|nr:DedA family protein [Chitinispirillaceae bacterium]